MKRYILGTMMVFSLLFITAVHGQVTPEDTLEEQDTLQQEEPAPIDTIQRDTADDEEGALGDVEEEQNGMTEGEPRDQQDAGGIFEGQPIQEARRRGRLHQAAGVGPAGLGNMDVTTVSFNGYYGGLWEVNPRIALNATAEATTNFYEALLVSGTVGADLYLFEGTVSPYLGGDLGLGWGTSSGDNAFGVELGTAVGVQLFRLSDNQVTIEAQTNILLDELTDAFPIKYAARVGLIF